MATNPVTTVLFPGAIVPLPQYMRDELRRRSGLKTSTNSGNYGLSYKKNSGYDINYKGPQTTWMRLCSNAIAYNTSNKLREGFVMYGGQGFRDAYGTMNKSSIKGSSDQIIGYDTKGSPHFLNSSMQPMRPLPSVESINVDIRKSIYRAAQITWKCYSVEQLNYMAKFFFTPYTTIVLEWGWNNYDSDSLLDISYVGRPAQYVLDETGAETSEIEYPGIGIAGAYTNPELIEHKLEYSHGNYDAMIGHIINFGYSFDPSDMSFKCTTEIASSSRFYFGLSVPDMTPKNSSSDKNASLNSLQTYVKNHFENEIKGLSELTIGIQGKQTPIDGRFFSFENFVSQHSGSLKSEYNNLYITFDLFTDMLNSFIGTQLGQTNISGIDIKDVLIGAHRNLISTSRDFIIPNSEAPVITSFVLSKPMGLLATSMDYKDDATKERPLDSFSVDKNSKEISDVMLRNIVGNDVKRQNLNGMVNEKRSGNKDDYAFPTKMNGIADPKQKKYCGHLKNIYISLNLVKEAVLSQQKISDVLQYVCNKLNSHIKIWDLHAMPNPVNQNLITIVDNRYLDVSTLIKSRELYGLKNNEPLIYYFDTFSQNSITTGFDFSVKLSSAIASMIVNQVNSNLGKDNNDQIHDRNILQPIGSGEGTNYVTDRILKEISIPQTKQTDKDQDDYIKKFKKGNVASVTDCESLFFKINNYVVRFCLPSSKSYILDYLISEDKVDPHYTNVSTMPVPGTTVTLTLLGIAGFKTFQVFGVENLPEPYRDKVLFKVTEVKHLIDSTNGWTTSITAMILPSESLTTAVPQLKP